MDLQATLDAITIINAAYTSMLTDGTSSVVRRILLRAQERLESDARRQLTGE